MTELRDAVWRAIQSWAVADSELDIELRASEVDAALDAFAQDRRADDWQEIETAPRDGTYVLGYGPHETRGNYVESVHYYRGLWTIQWMEGYGSPTHWRPLPKGPGG